MAVGGETPARPEHGVDVVDEAGGDGQEPRVAGATAQGQRGLEHGCCTRANLHARQLGARQGLGASAATRLSSGPIRSIGSGKNVVVFRSEAISRIVCR